MNGRATVAAGRGAVAALLGVAVALVFGMRLWPAHEAEAPPVPVADAAPTGAADAAPDPPVDASGWRPPVAEPIRWVPSNASPTKPTYVSSRTVFRPVDAPPPAGWDPPPGPRTRRDASTDPDARRRWLDEYSALREEHPEMLALDLLSQHVADYRNAAILSGADDALSALLLERMLGLEHLASDGLVPVEVVRAQGCVLVDVPCDLPAYMGCESAELLAAAAKRVCDDPTTALAFGAFPKLSNPLSRFQDD